MGVAWPWCLDVDADHAFLFYPRFTAPVLCVFLCLPAQVEDWDREAATEAYQVGN